MQEKAIKTTLEKEPEKKEQESTSEKEEKPKIVINKKIVIKCNDINDLKESFDLVKSNDNYINNILKIQPFTAPEILKKRMDELNLEKETKKNEDQKDISNSKICKQLKLPSGIVQITSKNSKDEKGSSYETDYSGLDPKVYEKFTKNITRELDILIGNAGIIFNKSPIMNSIVSKKINKFYLLDRIYIWQYYIKTLDDTEKIKLIRNFLYRLKLFLKSAMKN